MAGLSMASIYPTTLGVLSGRFPDAPGTALGLAQLGAKVTLLGEKELASANLNAFDTILTGTRAYAVREDLKT